MYNVARVFQHPVNSYTTKGSTVSSDGVLCLQASKGTWVEVRDRKQNVILSRRLAAGEVETLNGKAPFSVVIGYAEGTTVTWRGHPVDLVPHIKNKVVRLVLE